MASKFFGPEMLANPYPVYATMRQTQPVAFADALGGWVLTRFEEVSTVLRDPGTYSSVRFTPGAPIGMLEGVQPGPGLQKMLAFRGDAMIHNDAPKHTRLRSLVNKAFTPRSVEAMRPMIQATVDQLLDAGLKRGRGSKLELMEDLAYPLPVLVIAAMLGVPQEDRGKFKHWSDAITQIVNVQATLTREDFESAGAAYSELVDYFQSIVEGRSSHPEGSLLGAMAAAEEAGDKLSEAELYANAVLLLNAGHETTTNLIGNGTHALMSNRDQYEYLVANHSGDALDNAVEELLRYDSPVQFTTRVAKEAATLNGQAIEPGQSLMVVLGAANRDPAAFPDPDKLNLSRGEHKHAAFGLGPHYCLGAPLARLEARVVFSTLAARFPSLAHDAESPAPKYRNNFNLRGLESLHLKA